MGRRFFLVNITAWFLLFTGLFLFSPNPPMTSAQGAAVPSTTSIYEAANFEHLTVSTVALHVTSATATDATMGLARYAYCTVETNSIRYRYDGTAPTSSIGHLVTSGGSFTIYGRRNVGHLLMIRATADADVQCTYGY